MAEQEAVHERTAQRVAGQLAQCRPALDPTGYMRRKAIEPAPGVYTDAAGEQTVIPGYDAAGKHWTTQYVQADGRKRFARDSRKEGCFHVLGGISSLETAAALVIAEGYATAATVRQALGGVPVISAFDSGNLVASRRRCANGIRSVRSWLSAMTTVMASSDSAATRAG